MPTFTPNLGLLKPDPSEDVNVETDLNDNYDIIDAALSGAVGEGGISGFVDISATTAADGTTDDGDEINAAIDDSPAGSVIYFRPGLEWATSQPIILKSGRVYWGPGNGIGATNRAPSIKALAGFTGAGLMVAEAWQNNAATCDFPLRVQGIDLNGNSVSGTRGLILLNFWSRVYDVHVRNTGSHGIEFNDETANGTNVITNSASENTIVECRFANIGGDGVHQESNNQISNLDGRVIGCFFQSIDGHAVSLGRGAGWAIETNHFYGIGQDSIRSENCYALVVRGNYVEDFGVADASGGFYTGVHLVSVLNGRASIVANNTVSTEQPSSPNATRFACFAARAGSGQMRAMVVVEGNTAMFADGTAPAVARSQGFRFGEGGDTGRLLQVMWGANQIEQTTWWQRTRVTNVGVDLQGLASAGVFTLTDAATVTLDAPRAHEFRLTAAGNRTIGVPTDPVDGQEIVIAHTASGAARTLALTTGSSGSFAFTTTVGALTATTQDTTDFITCRYNSAAARWRVVSYSKG